MKSLRPSCEALRIGGNVIIHLDDSAPLETPRDLAQRSAALIHAIVKHCQIGALVVAGGDTSNTIIERLIHDPSLSAVTLIAKSRYAWLISAGGSYRSY